MIPRLEYRLELGKIKISRSFLLEFSLPTLEQGYCAVCREECDGAQFKEDQEGTSSTDCRDYQEVKVQEQVRFNMLDQTKKFRTFATH